MPEIGLLPFARVAMQVAAAALPTYRTRFSKHQFTQPQLLAILCLMSYEDWTFREAEVRLREHGELRAALRLSSVPDYTTVFCDVCRTTPSKTSWENRCVICAAVAIDGTGLLPQGVSTYFTRRVEQESSRKTRYRHFLKWIVVTDVDRQIVLAQRARQGPSNDAPTLPGLLETAGAEHAHRFGVGGRGVRLRSESSTYTRHGSPQCDSGTPTWPAQWRNP